MIYYDIITKNKKNNLLIWGVSFFALSMCLKYIDNKSLIFLQGLFLGLSLVFYGAAIYTAVKQK